MFPFVKKVHHEGYSLNTLNLHTKVYVSKTIPIAETHHLHKLLGEWKDIQTIYLWLSVRQDWFPMEKRKVSELWSYFRVPRWPAKDWIGSLYSGQRPELLSVPRKNYLFSPKQQGLPLGTDTIMPHKKKDQYRLKKLTAPLLYKAAHRQRPIQAALPPKDHISRYPLLKPLLHWTGARPNLNKDWRTTWHLRVSSLLAMTFWILLRSSLIVSFHSRPTTRQLWTQQWKIC